MRSARPSRILGAVIGAAVLAACGSGSPTTPDMPSVAVATGPQALRIIFQGQCPVFDNSRSGFFPIVYTHVTVTRSGSEWIARASSPENGTVELRFHQAGAVVIAGSMPVQGTIRGVAIHAAGLVPGVPPWNTRATFGADGTLVNGFAFSASSLTPTAGTSGVGSGSVTFSDDDGRSCSGSAFSWSLAAPPG